MSKYVGETKITDGSLSNNIDLSSYIVSLLSKGTVIVPARTDAKTHAPYSGFDSERIASLSKILKGYKPHSNQKYLYYALRAAKIPNLGYSRHFKCLKELKFAEYSEDEQQQIVDKLDKLSVIISLKTKELSLYDELIKARFVEMFGDGFETIELRNICKTTSGGTPSTKPDYYNGTIPWVTTTALGPNHIDGTKAKAYISEEAVANSATKIIPSGSILFGIRVGVGKTSINDVDICTNQDIVAIMDVNETKFSKLFIKHVLDTNRAHYDSLKKGATILGITSDDLKNTPIPLAPIKAQKDFETFVEQVDKSKFAVQKSLEKTQLLFDSLMQEYFG